MDDDLARELEALQADPRAKELLGETGGCLWGAELGPLNSDCGADALALFPRWRSAHPRQGLEHLLRSILGDWGVKRYDSEILDGETLQRQLEAEGEGFRQAVHVLDETILASALAQLILEGGIDAAAKPMVRLAAERQLHPLVLARLFEGVEAERARALREVLRLLEVSGETKEGRRRHVARLRRVEAEAARAGAAAKALRPCPWEVGAVLARRLPSGTRLLLHLHELQRYGEEVLPGFYVLSHLGEELPLPQELERMGPADGWTFALELPAAASLEQLPARAEALRAVLEPTGLTKAGLRRHPISRVPWERLDEYLVHNYDPRASAGPR